LAGLGFAEEGVFAGFVELGEAIFEVGVGFEPGGAGEGFVFGGFDFEALAEVDQAESVNEFAGGGGVGELLFEGGGGAEAGAGEVEVGAEAEAFAEFAEGAFEGVVAEPAAADEGGGPVVGGEGAVGGGEVAEEKFLCAC
jgi:hypothetical protein